VLTWPLIRKNLITGQQSAFWVLVFVIGFIEVMAFFASSYSGHWTVWLFHIQGINAYDQKTGNARTQNTILEADIFAHKQ